MTRRDLLRAFAAGSGATFGRALPAVRAPFRFEDISARAGLIHPVIYGGIETKKFILETNGCGIAFFDYDHDDWLDIFVPGGSRIEGDPPGATNRLYRNNRDGTFTDVTKKAGLERVTWTSGVCIGDYDNDGHDDLFLSCWGQNILYRNNGDGTFTDVTKEAGLLHGRPEWGAGCTFLDYNRDGFLDLFVSTYLDFDFETAPHPGATENCMWKGVAVNCGPRGLPTGRNFLYRNNGDGTFTDVSEAAGVAKVDKRYAMTAVAADFDDDGWPDLYVACDSTASILYKNNRDGTFTDIALEAGVAYNEDGREQAGMGLAVADVFGQGRLDIFKTHFADDTPILYRNTGRGVFEDVTGKSGFGTLTRYIGWGAGFADFDNNGLPDLLFVNGNVYPEIEKLFAEYPHKNPRLLLRNTGGGRFENVSGESGPGVSACHSSRGCALGDFDNDGRVDAVVMNMNEPPSLLHNETANENHWLSLKLVGTKSNRSAIGASVRLVSGGRPLRQDVLSQSSFYSQNDLRLHFGLGSAKAVDSVEVRWPSGIIQQVRGIRSDQIVTIREKS
jgi:enediyne biosynthesis protein E4